MNADQAAPAGGATSSNVRTLAVLALPAAIIGAGCGLMLWAVEELAGFLKQGLWTALPDALSLDPNSGWWIFTILTATGFAVGLVLWLVPGHGGADTAEESLVATPPAPRVLPSLLLVTILALAGGVSLGPESPIIAINMGIFVAIVTRLRPQIPLRLVVAVVAAGTIGALFGTPVAAALVLTEMVGALKQGEALWDRLFLPLVAAATGAVTMDFLAHPQFALALPSYTTITGWDLLAAAIIACLAAGLGIAAAVALPRMHAAFRLLRNPLVYATAGGVILGVLGAIGGPVTLFKGLEQMSELLQEKNSLSVASLTLIVAIKIVALVVSAAAGFRGGRIFPSVFIGMAFGVLVNALFSAVPLTVAIGAGVLGMLLAVSRDGWVSLFVAVAVTGSAAALPLLCIAVLSAWLLVSRAPEMIVRPRRAATAPAGASPEKQKSSEP